MDTHTLASQQYFPTYRLDKSGQSIGIKEYEAASRTLESDERLFSTATAILFVTVGLVSGYLGSQATQIRAFFRGIVSDAELFVFAFVLLGFATVMALRYFAARNRALVHASRKVIILRRMLGLSYGSVGLVLPANQVEGANEPYHVRMFHGWTTYKAVPFLLISIPSALIFYALILSNYDVAAGFLQRIGILLSPSDYHAVAYLISLLWFLIAGAAYRSDLMDQYEDWWRVRALNLAALSASQPSTILSTFSIGQSWQSLKRRD